MSDDNGSSSSTGIKAIIGVIVVCGLVGLKVWNRVPHYRHAATEQVQIAADQSFNFYFTLKKESKVKLDITKAENRAYYLALLTEGDFKKLKNLVDSGQGNPDEINFLLKKDCQGDHCITDQNLNAGTYYLWVECTENQPFNCQLDLAVYK